MTPEQEEKAAIKFIHNILKRCKGKECIFRGTTQIFSTQENVLGKKDGINSSLYRWAVEKESSLFESDCFPQDIEKKIVDKAKRRFYSTTNNNTEILTDIQHYGGKTNCIDFSTNLYIALFFACNGEFNQKGELIMLDKKGLKTVAEIDYNKSPPEPIEIIEPTITPTSKERVNSQASIFVRSQAGYLDTDSNMLETEAIPIHLKEPILEHLNKFCSINIGRVYSDFIGFVANEKNFENTLQPLQSQELTSVHTDITHSEPINVTNQKKNFEGEYHLAIENYTQFINLNPNHEEAYCSRGTAHAMLAHFQEAIQDYTKSIKLNPNFLQAYYNRGFVYAVTGENQEAEQDFDRVYQINPSRFFDPQDKLTAVIVNKEKK